MPSAQPPGDRTRARALRATEEHGAARRLPLTWTRAWRELPLHHPLPIRQGRPRREGWYFWVEETVDYRRRLYPVYYQPTNDLWLYTEAGISRSFARLASDAWLAVPSATARAFP